MSNSTNDGISTTEAAAGMARDGGPAFPVHGGGMFAGEKDDPRNQILQGGMSLRDWFAGQALAAMISKAPFFDRDGEFGAPVDMLTFKADMSESAYGYADAMIAARKVSP